jgi:hypothetical protein
LSVDAADPPAPVSGAPEGIPVLEIEGDVVGTVGGPELIPVPVVGTATVVGGAVVVAAEVVVVT